MITHTSAPYTNSWLKHAQEYVAAMVERFGLGSQSLVAEIAANDGYLLQYVRERFIPCYGVEPSGGVAAAARAKGIDIVQDFFSHDLASRLAAQGRQADLIVANNVLAHVPDVNDFVAGVAALLKPEGVATFEFPHLINLVRENQFDTIYHEHYSYLTLTVVDESFEPIALPCLMWRNWQLMAGAYEFSPKKLRACPIQRAPQLQNC